MTKIKSIRSWRPKI